jgi:hypothetical protein
MPLPASPCLLAGGALLTSRRLADLFLCFSQLLGVLKLILTQGRASGQCSGSFLVDLFLRAREGVSGGGQVGPTGLQPLSVPSSVSPNPLQVYPAACKRLEWAVVGVLVLVW